MANRSPLQHGLSLRGQVFGRCKSVSAFSLSISNPKIVFLTIVHLHYAGFVLPILAGLATKNLHNRFYNQIACYFTVAAVGLLAFGIIFTQLGIGYEWELVSAGLMALSATIVAAMHLRLAFNTDNHLKIRVL